MTARKTTKTTEPARPPILLTGSDMAALHRSRGILGRALNTLPDWVETVGHLHHLDEMKLPRPTVRDVPAEIADRIRETIETRRSIDIDAELAHVQRTRVEAETFGLLEQGIAAARVVLVQRLDETVRHNRVRLHSHVTNETRRIITDARQHVGALHLDAEQAITASQVEDWKALGDLRRQFNSVADIRSTLNGRLGWNPDAASAGYGELLWISNPEEVFEHWRAWRIDGHLIDKSNTGRKLPLTPPWPQASQGVGAIDGWFEFLVETPQADPWLPTPEQFNATAARLDGHLEGLRNARPSRSQSTQGRDAEPEAEPEWTEDTRGPRPSHERRMQAARARANSRAYQ